MMAGSDDPEVVSAPDARDQPVLEISGLTRRYAGVPAVADLSLRVERRELLALLGPSGCGKTTTLRLIAGFERPDSGTVALNGKVVAGPSAFVPPERRHIGVVFQDYALFPHLTVAQNVGYGVRNREQRRDRPDARVRYRPC